MALLDTVTLPGKLPAETGVKLASNTADCPGARISPAETPLVEYDAPDKPTLDTVTSEFPAFVRETLKELVFPRATVPKFKLGTLAVRSAVATVPVPLSETVLGELDRLEMTAMSPARAPADFGEKTTLNEACFPASITRGSETPAIETPVAVAPAFVMVRIESPPFDMVTDWEEVLPTGTEPKRSEAGASEIVAPVLVVCLLVKLFDALVSPMQPELERIARSKIRKGTPENNFLALVSVKGCIAAFAAPQDEPCMFECFIKGILIWGNRRGLLSRGATVGQGKQPELAHFGRGKRRAALITVAGRPAEIEPCTWRPDLWDVCRNFSRVGAFDSAGIDRSNYVIISRAGLDRGIHIRGRCDRCGSHLCVWAAAHRGPVHIVA